MSASAVRLDEGGAVLTFASRALFGVRNRDGWQPMTVENHSAALS
jgi:hypothetical protein